MLYAANTDNAQEKNFYVDILSLSFSLTLLKNVMMCYKYILVDILLQVVRSPDIFLLLGRESLTFVLSNPRRDLLSQKAPPYFFKKDVSKINSWWLRCPKLENVKVFKNFFSIQNQCEISNVKKMSCPMSYICESKCNLY